MSRAELSHPTEPPEYAVQVPLRWGDMDAFGHINNVEFLRLLEQARVIAFRDWYGVERSVVKEGLLVAHQEIDYLVQLDYRSTPIEVGMWISRVGGAGYDIAYVVRDSPDEDGTPGTVYAVAESSLVLFDFERGTPARLSAEARAGFAPFLGPPAPLRRRKHGGTGR